MRRITWITEQAFCFSADDFYRAIDSIIDDSGPRLHMSCDWLEDPLVFGFVIFPLAIYQKMGNYILKSREGEKETTCKNASLKS